MRTSIIKIGNSSGIIIPRGVMRTLVLTERSAVTMQVSTDGIVIKKTPARNGWSEAAQKMRRNGDDELLLPDVFEDEVFEESAMIGILTSGKASLAIAGAAGIICLRQSERKIHHIDDSPGEIRPM
ncbi:AbrB/MazE/SpoVT family DNA-binding domain-containing protein [Porphyromonas levii]|uniref:AbrB/MazE/SpoVT family DNA-binding domain-containing protein n=1 Tax=Porphyromonas levii TaxID=28114 RepID=UPI0020135A6B|nr:hypothetical protein [Porphyromonas levii]MBR8803578.1 hypothetical protein [Porphyromonas levii]